MKRLLALLPALLCAACARDIERPPTDDGPWPATEIHAAVADYLGAERIDVLRAPDAVTAYRVDGDPRSEPEPGAATIDGWPLLATGPALAPDQVRRFQQLAFDAGNYEFQMAKACIFDPGVSLRFEKRGRVVDALLCFSCDMWGFDLDGELLTEDFDPVRGDLVRLSQELFPDDATLQALRADR
jgi:hypothetical protein